MRFAQTKVVNTRVYLLSPKEQKERKLMISKIWIGALVVHGCCVVASADLYTLTMFLSTFLANATGFIYYNQRR